MTTALNELAIVKEPCTQDDQITLALSFSHLLDYFTVTKKKDLV